MFGLYQIFTFLFSGGLGMFISGVTTGSMTAIAMSFLGAIAMIAVFTLLIFYSDKIIQLLSLDKGYDNSNVTVGDISQSKLGANLIIIVGVYFFVEGLLGTV